MRHFTSSADGLVVTMEANTGRYTKINLQKKIMKTTLICIVSRRNILHPTGKVAWSQDYGAPIVAMYMMDSDGMKKIPFTSMAMETLDHLQGEVASEVWREQFLQYENDNRF